MHEQYPFKMEGAVIVGNFMFIGFLILQILTVYKKFLPNTF